MAKVTVTSPEHWEDWCDWGLGIWLCLSPWILRYDLEPTATRNAVVVGLLVVFAEVVTLSAWRAWEEWINVALGAWLVISPFALGVVSAAAKANFLIVGALIAGLALYEVWEVRRTARGPEPRGGS